VEARELKATLTADVKRGEYRALSRITFAEYAAEWIASYTGRTSRGIRPERAAVAPNERLPKVQGSNPSRPTSKALVTPLYCCPS
jgi:hypothetical protein